MVAPPKRPSSPRKQAAMQRLNYTPISPTIFNLPTQYVVSVFLPYFMKIGYFFHRNLLHISGNFRNFALAIRRVDLPTAEAWRSLGYV